MVARVLSLVAVLVVVVIGAGTARAADAPAPPAPPAASAGGSGQQGMGKPRHTGPGWFTWVGFEKTEAGARVLVRLSSPSGGSVGQARAGDELIVTFPGYKLDTKNDGRPLDTRYFNSDLVRIQARQTKVGIEVHVRFRKEATEARVSTVGAEDGETLIYLDF